MENKLDYPRICCVLGEGGNPIKPGEIFTFSSLEGEFAISNEGLVCRVINGFPTTPLPGLIVCDFINHPEKIQRLPAVSKSDFSEDEIGFMRVWIKTGFPWAARNGNGILYFYHSKPVLRNNSSTFRNDGEGKYTYIVDGVLPKIAHEISPIDMRLICGE